MPRSGSTGELCPTTQSKRGRRSALAPNRNRRLPNGLARPESAWHKPSLQAVISRPAQCNCATLGRKSQVLFSGWVLEEPGQTAGSALCARPKDRRQREPSRRVSVPRKPEAIDGKELGTVLLACFCRLSTSRGTRATDDLVSVQGRAAWADALSYDQSLYPRQMPWWTGIALGSMMRLI